MHALITLTHRSVEHNDPDAAGFVDGYWWTLTTDHPAIAYVESASPTAERSEDFARGMLRRRALEHGGGAFDITVVREDDLLDRRADEARVALLIAQNPNLGT